MQKIRIQKDPKHYYPGSMERKEASYEITKSPSFLQEKIAILIGEAKKIKNLIRKE